MGSKWFDFDEEFASSRDSFELLKKNFGLSTRKAESERKLNSWSSVNRVSDILDLESTRTGILWDSVIKDRLTGKTKCRDHHRRTSDTECDEMLADLSESARQLRNRFSREFDSDIYDRRMRRMHSRESPSCSSTFSYPDSGGDHTWSRKSSCQGNVTFPESSTASVNSDTKSEKSFGRSISVNSEDSVCTEKSADCSTVCETLPDGTNKTQFENNETWLAKSNSGSICEKKIKDSTVTEKNEDRLCDKTTKKTSYIERSATGSSLQEESMSERVVSCDKTGKKTVEQKTSSETYKKAYRSPKTSSSFYDDLDACSLRGRHSNYRKNSGKPVSEKISKLVSETVRQDNLFGISSNIEADIDRMTNDFAERTLFERDKKRHDRRRPFSEIRERGFDDSTEAGSCVLRVMSSLGEVQSQMDLITRESCSCSSHECYIPFRMNDLVYNFENLKSRIDLLINVFESQRREYKDKWEAERKEKQEVIQKKEDLEKKVQELTAEVETLENTLTKKTNLCGPCKDKMDTAAVFPGNTFFPVTFRTAVHVPYNADGKDFFPGDWHSKRTSCLGDSYASERFPGCSIKTSGETIVVEDENGIRLSITEQFPSKDSLQLRSILKKADKKQKLVSKTGGEKEMKKSAHNRKSSSEDAKTTSVSIGYENDRLARVTSFSPHPNTEFLQVGNDIRSKSEPNTRSNSSENLKPLRESSSWNNQCPTVDANVCSGCDPTYTPVSPEFLTRNEY